MKAHLIISENENNRRQVLNLLTYYIKKGCKNYTDKLKVYQNYDHPDFDKQLYESNAGILLLNNFPSDLVTALKPNNEHITIVFTNSDELNSVYNGGFNDYQVYYLSRFDDVLKAKILARLLYYEICFEFVLKSNWSKKSKANLLEYYNSKIRKELGRFLEFTSESSYQKISNHLYDEFLKTTQKYTVNEQ